MDQNLCENCSNCTPATVPYILYEAALDREQRRTRKYAAAFVVALAALLASNVAWVIAVIAR